MRIPYPVARPAPSVGGADVPFEPSPEDWREYESWARTRDYLDRFNAVRDDSSEVPA
jgi:hypothetical protein